MIYVSTFLHSPSHPTLHLLAPYARLSDFSTTPPPAVLTRFFTPFRLQPHEDVGAAAGGNGNEGGGGAQWLAQLCGGYHGSTASAGPAQPHYLSEFFLSHWRLQTPLTSSACLHLPLPETRLGMLTPLPLPLDINLVYEVWKDVKVKAVQVTHPNPFVHIPRLLFIWGGCNAPCALLLVAASRAVYGPHS